MNIHPIFVHFPVALLSVYSIMECVRFRRIMAQDYWFYTKGFLLVIGTLASYAALYTGGLAEDLRRQASRAGADRSQFQLIDVHSNWAVAVAVIFSVISLIYIIDWVRRSMVLSERFASSKIWLTMIRMNNILLKAPIIIPLAVAGFVAITVTGALGGAIEYGHNSDPIVNLIYNLIF